MARLAVSVAGAAIGGFLGGPTGAQWGFLAGSLLGAYAFPDKLPDVVGPRLGDKTVSSSAYGAPIAIGFGTIRESGNVIWSSGIVETRHSSSVSGGKGGMGGGSQKSITYTYSCSFAIAFGEGVAEDVIRIWADSKLIFDKTGTGQLAKTDVAFRFYSGSETQLPDSIIEAHEGAENTPAFRGLCYIVFDDLQLADFGNRIPNITAEITYNKQDVLPYILDTRINTPVTSWQGDELCVDSAREYFYLINALGTPGMRRFDARTMKELRSALWDDISSLPGETFPNMLGIDSKGFIHCSVGASNGRPIILVDPITLKERMRFGEETADSNMTPTGFGLVAYMTDITLIGAKGPRTFYVYASLLEGVGVLDEDFAFIAGLPLELPVRPCGLCSGGGVVYFTSLAAGGSATMYVHKMTIDPGAKPVISPTGSWLQSGVELELVRTITTADLGGSGTFSSVGVPMYDETDGAIVFSVSGSSVPCKMVKVRDGVIKWTSTVPNIVPYPASPPATSLKYGKFGFIQGKTTYTLDLRDGSWTSQKWGPALPVQQTAVQYYNDKESSIITVDNSAGRWFKVFLDRGDGLGGDLGVIVADLCSRVGLDLADIDVTELTDTVRGYVISKQMSARNALQPLLEAFLFDGVESDYILKFLKRGRSVSYAIPMVDLAFVKDGEVMTESRTQEVELPAQVSVVYMSKEQDYQSDTQIAKRTVQPKPAMYSHNKASKEVPIVFTAEEAARLADVLLYQSWIERSAFVNTLPWKYLPLDPADVVTITADGITRKCRVGGSALGVDMSIELESISEDAALYTSSVDGVAASGFPPQYILAEVPSTVWFMDTPLLRDQDDTGGSYSLNYFVIGTARTDDWKGAFLYRSRDANAWEDRATALVPVVYGTVTQPLNDPRSPWELDVDSVVRVYVEDGELESCTYEELMNGANACVIEGEVCGFMDASLGADGYYTLTNWIRGMRGTDYAVNGHTVGARITMLSSKTVHTDTVNIDQLNTSFMFRAVTFATLLEDAETVGFTPDGKDLKPYSPVLLDATNSSGDVVITWVRRTRLAGGLMDGTDYVPNSEAFEKYEVDVYVGGSVVRTLSVQDATTVTYTAAQQAADGYVIGTGVIEVEVFMLSAVVGRGFGRREILEV